MSAIENLDRAANEPKDSGQEPLSKREPSAPFALVGLSYLIILAFASMVIAAYLFFV